MIYLYVIVASVVTLWFLGVDFVALMNFRRVKRKWGLTLPQKVLAYPLLVIGYPLDVLARLTVFAVLFLRWPKLETVSELLDREVEGSGWRATQAWWWREKLLADFDMTGDHGDPGR